jgi:hypothetical protein
MFLMETRCFDNIQQYQAGERDPRSGLAKAAISRAIKSAVDLGKQID